MTTTEGNPARPTAVDSSRVIAAVETGPRFGPWGTPLIVTAGIIVVSLVSYWVLADQRWSWFIVYPQPVGAFLFWSILVTVITGVTFQNRGFDKLRQPLAGIFQTVVIVGVAVAIPNILVVGFGRLDPAFTHDGGAGWAAAAFIVLVGFFVFPLLAGNWGGWPWTSLDLTPRASSWAQTFMGFTFTTIGYLLIAYPAFAAWGGAAHPQHTIFGLSTALGWFYSCLLVQVLSLQIWDNRPWGALRLGWAVAACSTLGILALGTAWYFLVRGPILNLLVPSQMRLLSSWSRDTETAQFGVGVVVWAILWGTVFGGWPVRLSAQRNRMVRTLIVFLLGCATYVGYNRLWGTGVVHDTPLRGTYGGDPLTFLDWVILVNLIYVIVFGAYGSTRPAGQVEPHGDS
jgi:AAT family amino acid transporter